MVYNKISNQLNGENAMAMDEYILFVDETFKTGSNPYFCMSGICMKRSDYEDIAVKQINELKKRHFT